MASRFAPRRAPRLRSKTMKRLWAGRARPFAHRALAHFAIFPPSHPKTFRQDHSGGWRAPPGDGGVPRVAAVQPVLAGVAYGAASRAPTPPPGWRTAGRSPSPSLPPPSRDAEVQILPQMRCSKSPKKPALATRSQAMGHRIQSSLCGAPTPHSRGSDPMPQGVDLREW